MRNRTILILLLLLLAVFLISKFDVLTRVKIIAANMIYGEELRNIKGLRVVVEAVRPELKMAGLSEESIREELISRLKGAGIKILAEDEWQKLLEKPELNLKIIADKNEEGMYSFIVTIDVTKRNAETQTSNIFSHSTEKVRTVWISSGMGKGDVSDIREKARELTGLFLKAHSGS
jgi:hypothetical protein